MTNEQLTLFLSKLQYNKMSNPDTFEYHKIFANIKNITTNESYLIYYYDALINAFHAFKMSSDVAHHGIYLVDELGGNIVNKPKSTVIGKNIEVMLLNNFCLFH